MLCKGWGRWRTAAAAVLLVLSASLGGLIPGVVQARGPVYLAPADTIAMAQLPAQGRSMIGLIYQGGPFRHEKDGVVFGNRGARRIVCGGLQPDAPDACYYTDDHYASYRRIVQ